VGRELVTNAILERGSPNAPVSSAYLNPLAYLKSSLDGTFYEPPSN
jgi:hypothetical protein